jgi:glycosyltransferase involved in cell wall biosynthesis
MGFSWGSVLYVSLGQTWTGLVRDGVPLWLAYAWRRKKRVVISLNGSNFMEWNDQGVVGRIFVRLLRLAKVITVLGESQQKRLIALGIARERVRIVPNTCEVTGLDEHRVSEKQHGADPLRILFLSSLIDTKGYPEYLEAMTALSAKRGPFVEAILCGPLTASQFGERFQRNKEARQWIESKIAEINSSSRARACWIPGARGDAKWTLYQKANIFVLPSRYSVEAQPIVLLEAMAHGCAIITTSVGEIRTILSENEARFLSAGSAEEVAEAIEQLVLNAAERQRLALAGLRRFQREFSLDRYVQRWEGIFAEVASV